jgi:hypothetical protein
MERAIEYLNLSLLESFGGARFDAKERWNAVSEALRLLHHGLGHQPNCKRCADKKIVEVGKGFTDVCPDCRPRYVDEP